MINLSRKLLIIGIDSLDPHILKKYRRYLPNFSQLIAESPTFISNSVFPVDTIPAWGSIYTGLNPANHGLLYVYDVFDPNLSDLSKLNVNNLKGKTFWDYANQNGYNTSIVFPMLVYPPWEINGLMLSKSPFDKRVDWLRTEINVGVFPDALKNKYDIPEKLEGLWGGFPGYNNLEKWANLGKKVLKRDTEIGLKLSNEKSELFFIYFSQLDIIQHRLWRFFDKDDPSYPGTNIFERVILDYYMQFDKIIASFIDRNSGAGLMIISDHGHKSRPIKTINLNEYLRRKNFLVSNARYHILQKIKKNTLNVISKLNLEHWIIKIVSKNPSITKVSKSVYSSAGSIDRKKTLAFLSNYAGIKSYPHGGIELNRDILSNREYDQTRDLVIESLVGLKSPSGDNVIKWIEKREEKFPGKFTDVIYPDILFELNHDYGVGWDLHSETFGKALDHNVASGGHGPECVLIMNNINKEIKHENICITDVTPTIMDYLEIDYEGIDFDGRSIFK